MDGRRARGLRQRALVAALRLDQPLAGQPAGPSSLGEGGGYGGGVVGVQQQVNAGGEGLDGALRGPPRARTFHHQRVGDDRAVEPEPASQATEDGR